MGCSSDTDGSSQAGTLPPPIEASQAANVPPPPEVGQCRNTPDSNLDDDDWVDDTPVVERPIPGHAQRIVQMLVADSSPTASQCRPLGTRLDAPLPTAPGPAAS